MPIRFIIKPGGAVKVEPVAYTGTACHQATQPYEDRLGGKQRTVPTADLHKVQRQNKNELKTNQ